MTFMTGPMRISALALAAASALAAPAARAADCPEGFPGGPIEFWVGYAAGGGTDLISRQLAAILEEEQGWTVSVSNRPGAGSSVMMTQLAVQPPDGRTIGITSTGSVTKVPNRNPDSPYDYHDFTYLGTAQVTPVGVASLTSMPFTTYEEMMDYGREKGILTIASPTNDSDIFFDAISEREGVNIVTVPSEGTSGSLAQVLGGHVDAVLLGNGHVQQLRSGEMQQLFTLGEVPAAFAPDAPTSVDLGYDFVGAVSYVLVAAPANMDPAIQTCLETALDEAVNTPAFADFQALNDQTAYNAGHDGITAMIEKDSAYFAEFYADEANQ
ncbi:tripartite tricarboxylate transporter substrate binding protein [Pseudoroseicyclus sp. H15]